MTRIDELAEKVYEGYFTVDPKYRTGQRLIDLVAAALTEFREEAAKCADERVDVAKIGNVYHYLNDKYTRGVCDASEQIASAIRKL